MAFYFYITLFFIQSHILRLQMGSTTFNTFTVLFITCVFILSKCVGLEIHSFRSHIRITSFGVEIHAQTSGIHFQKSDSIHYFHDFGVDSTMLRVNFHSKTK